KSWFRVSPAGVIEASRSRKRARVSVVKLPNVSCSACRLSASTEWGGEGAARRPARCNRGEQVEKAGPRLGGEAAERQLLGLPLERLHVVGVAVADGADAHAGDEVHGLVAVPLL